LFFVKWLANSLEICLGKVVIVAVNDNSFRMYLESDEGSLFFGDGFGEGLAIDISKDFI
jgi:hypothetical protein